MFSPHAPADAIVVPDAHLLFNANFTRSGVDLILSKDDREIVLYDYFKGEKHRALASPDGAHLTPDLVDALVGEIQVSQADGSASAHQVIGHVTKLEGGATVVRNGVSIILNMGDNVEKGDVVQSGSNSTLGLTFIDGTVFGLSSNARMVLNEMVYDPNGSNNSSLISLVAGTISFVAGQTAKHGDMKIDTPVATMGIRGTAVLVEIDFSVPGQNGQPNASFQVLVEPDGTTGSYILFDKTTLQPIAVVNQAGQQININNGVVSQTNSQLSPDVQKLIQDVFTQKFTDNTNTKSTSPFNDSITPQSTPPIIKLADGTTATPVFTTVNASSGSSSGPNGPTNSISHIPGPPKAVVLDVAGHVTTSFFQTELAGKTADAVDHDIVTGAVNFVDINAGDAPTVSVSFSSATYQNAQHQNMTLSALQQADIAQTEINVLVVPGAGNNNNGSANWTYSIPDDAFDFLAAGETLTLTYQVRVDNNYAPNNEATTIPITITITGTNDVPVITGSAPTIAFSGGKNVSGGNLPLLDPDPVTGTKDPTSGTLSFKDVDLTDTHTVSAELTGAVGVLNGSTVLNGVDELPPGPLDLLKAALTASIGTDSTGTGFGTINWNLADLPVYIADFISTGEKLTLTYTVTLTDSQGATTTTDVTVTITGANTPAVVWIDTTASQSGGQWNVGTNWETGTVPTATDDAIIITNQLIGLTPIYPVTITTTADHPTAAARSLTMNDFGPLLTNSPTLINQSTLAIGSGGISLEADSIVENDKSAIISVAGSMEVLDQSSLQNYGQIMLEGGGDFKDQSTITNFASGTIEVSGGALNVLVDVANSGLITVDAGAALALAGGTIDGGTVSISGTLELEGAGILKNGSLDNSGQINVSGIGNGLDGETVTANSALEIMAGGALLIDQGSSITNGKLTVDGTAMLTLNDATVSGGTVTNASGGIIDLTGGAALKSGLLGNSGQIDVSGSGNALDGETVTANLVIEILSGGALTIDQGSAVANSGGTVTVDGSGTLTLNDATIMSGTVTNETKGTIDLNGSAVLSGGTLGNSGQINVGGSDNALDGEIVTNSEAGAIDITGVLTLDLGTSIAGGQLTNFGTLFIEGPGVTLDGVNVDNTSGTIHVDAETPTLATLKLKNGTTISNGTLTIGIVGILEISTSLGATLSGVNAGDSGTIQVDVGSMLTLDGTTITGSALTNYGSVFIETAVGSTFDGVSVDNTSGKIEVDTGNGNPSPTTTLTLDDGTTITNGTLTIGTVGILDVSKSLGATLFGVSVGNFGTVEVDAESVLTLDGTTITGGTVTDYGTVKVDSGDTLKLSGVALSGGAISNAGTIEITGSGSVDNDAFANTDATLIVDANTTLTLDGTTITGGTVTDHGSINVDGGDTLTLIGTTIAGGELTVAGILDSTGISAIDDTTITNTGTIEATGGTLTIDPDQPFTLTNSGTLEADGGEFDISGELVTNTGLLQAIDDSTLKLTATLVANSATISDTDGSTIDLVDAAISGGALKIAGTFDSAGSSALDGVAITNFGTFEVTSGKLIIDSASSVSNTAGGTLEANGGALIINGSLSGNAEIVGGSFLELGDAASGAYSAATVTFAAGSTGTLKLDHAESFSGTVAGLDDNTLDLGDIAYGSHPAFVYAGNTSGGTLEVFVKGVDVANIKLSGDYLGSSWSATGDGSGGTDITEVPGALSGLDSHGDADQGVKLTASITDAGEPVTNATYTFETSTDGAHWTTVQSGTNSSYTPADRDEGKQLQVVLSFTDSSGHQETSTVSAGTVQDNPNDHPTILGETDPALQTIILDESPVVLAAGVITNSLGLPTEAFDEVSPGSLSNNGSGHGNFTNVALDATFSSSGDAGVVDGSSSVSAAPFIGPSPGQVDNTHYLSIGAGGTETISFATEQNEFGLYWGSVDPSNTIDFYNGTKLVASYTGADISPLLASGGQGSFASNGYVEFSDLVPFNKVVLSNGNANAFEIDNISAGFKSDSHVHLAAPITGTLTVSDDDVGDTLTASVSGDAVVKYNGSTILPSGVNVDALINPNAVTFDSVKADGGADVLHWTYNPTNPDLDFLESGDTLTITFNAQVSDGHATAGNQPLAVTLVGTGASVINGTAQNDTFEHVGGGVTIFGSGGNDTFVFSPNFGSATIGNFNVLNDTIDIDHTLFSNVATILASAQPTNFGHDTTITDAAHDKIVLTGVTVTQLAAHPNDFHLV